MTPCLPDEYRHQTYNHLVFDRIRAIQLEVEFLASYLRQNNKVQNLDGAYPLDFEIRALDKCSRILFDEVYHPLRCKWI